MGGCSYKGSFPNKSLSNGQIAHRLWCFHEYTNLHLIYLIPLINFSLINMGTRLFPFHASLCSVLHACINHYKDASVEGMKWSLLLDGNGSISAQT